MTKHPKGKYKNQIRNEMMKTFGKLFSSSSEESSLEENKHDQIQIHPGEPVYDLLDYMKKLSKNYNGLDGYEIEYESLLKIDRLQFRQGNTFKTGQLSKNIKKNRYPKILPNEKTRVKLSDPKKEGNDYINANYIPSQDIFFI